MFSTLTWLYLSHFTEKCISIPLSLAMLWPHILSSFDHFSFFIPQQYFVYWSLLLPITWYDFTETLVRDSASVMCNQLNWITLAHNLQHMADELFLLALLGNMFVWTREEGTMWREEFTLVFSYFLSFFTFYLLIYEHILNKNFKYVLKDGEISQKHVTAFSNLGVALT